MSLMSILPNTTSRKSTRKKIQNTDPAAGLPTAFSLSKKKKRDLPFILHLPDLRFSSTLSLHSLFPVFASCNSRNISAAQKSRRFFQHGRNGGRFFSCSLQSVLLFSYPGPGWPAAFGRRLLCQRVCRLADQDWLSSVWADID